jgi:quercetin dioxygenase-like cupin family protein
MKSVLIAATLVLSASMAIAQQSKQAGTAAQSHAIVALPNAIAWAAAPPTLPAGARLAVLEGNPANPGPFTMRLEMPARYRIPPHYHPVTEHVTVISGTFYVGMGETFDETKATRLPTGTFAALDPGVRHFAFTKGKTVIQLHGTGPWSLAYVNPADDPRSKTR